MNDRFKRSRQFIGESGFQRVRGSSVLVAGLGGVGIHCASALARSGVGKLYLMDFDQITTSSLNRNPFAGIEDVGKMKASFSCSTLSRLCPDTEFVPVQAFLSREYIDENGLPGGLDAVADAIDSLNPKTQLLEHCVSLGIPAFSSMGAAGRRDPSMVRTGDISRTERCPLARMVRKYLKRRGISDGIACVWSVEDPAEPLPPDDEPVLQRRGRTRNALPSLITLPGVFGYSLAQMIIDRIAREAEPPRSV